MDIVNRMTPEERELETKRSLLATLESELAGRELELATLRGTLNAFKKKYLSIVGVTCRKAVMTTLFSSWFRRLMATCLSAVLLGCIMAGCEMSPEFRGKVTFRSGEVVKSSKAYGPQFAFEDKLPDGQRLIVLGVNRREKWLSIVLVLMVPARERGEVQVTGKASTKIEAWLIETDQIDWHYKAGHYFPDAVQEYCLRFAHLSVDARTLQAGATRLVGAVTLQEAPLDTKSAFDVRVALRPEPPQTAPAIEGRFGRYFDAHPEYIPIILMSPLLPFLGGDPL